MCSEREARLVEILVYRLMDKAPHAPCLVLQMFGSKTALSSSASTDHYVAALDHSDLKLSGVFFLCMYLVHRFSDPAHRPPLNDPDALRKWYLFVLDPKKPTVPIDYSTMNSLFTTVLDKAEVSGTVKTHIMRKISVNVMSIANLSFDLINSHGGK